MILVQSCGSSVTASGAEEGSSSSPSPGSERERGASACMRRHQASALAPVLRLGPRLPHAAAPQGPRDRTPGDNITRSRPSIELLQPTRTGVGARARALPVATYRFPVIILKVCMLYIYSQTVELLSSSVEGTSRINDSESCDGSMREVVTVYMCRRAVSCRRRGFIVGWWLYGAPCSSSHLSTSSTPAAKAHVLSSHGQWCSRAHFNTSKRPLRAAPRHVFPSHGQS